MRRATECGVVRDHSLGVYGPNARSANTEAAHDIVHPFYMLQGRLGQRIFAALLECLGDEENERGVGAERVR